METSSINRRGFLKGVGLAGAAFSIVRPEQVWGTAANSRIEVGCIGHGGRGSMIANMFAAHEGFQVTAVCDYFDRFANAAGDRLKVAKDRRFSGLSGYKRMIEAGVDAVVLKTPPYCFPDHATAAVEAGCSVYVAKPVAVDVPGCLQMLKMGRLATKKKLVFIVDFQLRVNPHVMECIRLLRKGIIGDVHFIRSYYDDEGYRDPPLTANAESRFRGLVWCNDIALGGGKLVNSGIHAVDGALWIAGRNPISACGSSAIVRENPHGDTKDIYSITYRFEGDDLLINHTGESYRNLSSRIAHCDAYGEGGYMEARYSEKSWIRSEKKGFEGGYKGGEKGDIYRYGPLQNIATFHKSITEGIYDNPTVEPSVNSTLACILGKEAAARNTTVTWDEMIKENKRIEADLSGLKQ